MAMGLVLDAELLELGEHSCLIHGVRNGLLCRNARFIPMPRVMSWSQQCRKGLLLDVNFAVASQASLAAYEHTLPVTRPAQTCGALHKPSDSVSGPCSSFRWSAGSHAAHKGS